VSDGPKHPRFELLGAVDELNAHVGLAREYCLQSAEAAALPELDEVLVGVQSRLLDAGSSIATPLDTSSTTLLARAAFPPAELAALERHIDAFDAQLSPLKNFILPGGGLVAAQLHVARTVCRRAERLMVPLAAAEPPAVEPVLLRYMNRLSDFLFVAARFAALQARRADIVYKKTRKE